MLDYENYTIYCEGRWNRNKNLEEYLLRTVAVEFECVDAIYEEAVKDGFILDALGNSDDLLQRLQNEKEIVIIGIGADSQDVYDCLLGKGIEAVCFLSFSQEDYGRQLFDKEILSESDIRNKFQNPVFIDCQNRNSAWGFGKTDHYDYMGYHRNVRYILWRDYQDILSNNLYHVLKGKNIILLGEELRCRRIQRNLRERGHLNVTYENILDEIHQGSNSFNNSLKDTVYLLTIDEGYEIDNEAKQKSLREKYIRRLSEIGIFSFSEYFSDFERMAKLRDKNSDGMASILKPKGILVGVIDFFSGNILFNGIMDGHPNILSMPHCCLCNMLYSVSIRLAEEKAECFIDRFWILLNEYSNDEYDLSQEFPDKEVFERKVYELLAGKSSFISQEIFVILFMAYSSMWGQETSELQNSFIYWESHGMNRLNLEICAEWLAMADIQIFEIKLKRNSLVRAGSAIKIYESQTKFTASSVPYVGIGLVSERKKMQQINLHSYYMKFEDLKQYPERELKKICLWAGLTWNKSMLTTTEHGKVSGYECLGESISGFDLKPVYRLYEEYLSEFDRMRIGMINQLFQKKYGYSYVKSMDFSRYELQEMMLRPFKFEKMLTFINDRDYLRYRKKMYRILHYWLQKIRRMEILNIEDDMEYFR